MTGRRTFASSEDRENYELDRLDEDAPAIAALDTRLDAEEAATVAFDARLDSDETTILDHEDRITTLESGGGSGGMAEEMYARFTATGSTVGDGSTGRLELSASDEWGTDVPLLTATGGIGFPTNQIEPQKSGYHLLSVEVLPDTIGAAEVVIVEVTAGILSAQTFRIAHRVWDDGGLGLRQRSLVGLHLLGADDLNAGTLEVSVRTVNSTTDHELSIAVGLSRIGTNVAGAPDWHTEV